MKIHCASPAKHLKSRSSPQSSISSPSTSEPKTQTRKSLNYPICTNNRKKYNSLGCLIFKAKEIKIQGINTKWMMIVIRRNLDSPSNGFCLKILKLLISTVVVKMTNRRLQTPNWKLNLCKWKKAAIFKKIWNNWRKL